MNVLKFVAEQRCSQSAIRTADRNVSTILRQSCLVFKLVR
jgi:hypothetical protein